MFSLIESKEKIAEAQHKLDNTIQREFKNKAVKNIGWRGGTIRDAKVFTDEKYWFWTKDREGFNHPSSLSNPVRLNWFGRFRKDSSLHISVEINTPYEGRNDQLAGFFARNIETGAIYLFHSGRVAGGKKGVNKVKFLAWCSTLDRSLQLHNVYDSTGGIRDGVLVMPVEGKAATRSVVQYIDTITNFKKAVQAGETESPEFQRNQKKFEDFYSESTGRRKGKRSEEIDYISRHGDIVDALHNWRKSDLLPSDARLVKNLLIDLGVETNDSLTEVYEVKTSTKRSDVYTAIGQLMVHGIGNNCQKVMVLPQQEKPIAQDLVRAMNRLDIRLLRFKLDEMKAIIV